MFLGYTYYCFTHRKILVLMVPINKACEERCFIFFNFHFFSVILSAHGHKGACNLPVVYPIGLYLVASCFSCDSTLGSIVFIT